MKNLLEETVSCLEDLNKTPEDVYWVGAPHNGYITWNEFTKLANVDYDNGFGTQLVASDLVVVGDGWWLERWEYDGSEGWACKKKPTKPLRHITPKRLVSAWWGGTLRELQEKQS